MLFLWKWCFIVCCNQYATLSIMWKSVNCNQKWWYDSISYNDRNVYQWLPSVIIIAVAFILLSIFIILTIIAYYNGDILKTTMAQNSAFASAVASSGNASSLGLQDCLECRLIYLSYKMLHREHVDFS